MSSFCRLKGCLGTRDVEILAATLRKLTPRMSYPRCPGTVERAFAPLVEHFGYAWAIGGRSENRSVYHLEDQLGPALTGALEELDLWSTAVHVVDLHGDRARTARERLERPLPGIRVIYFGKGAGVLARIFEEWAEKVSEELVVVGVSGHTDAEPVPSVGVVVPRALVDAIESVLDAPQEQPRKSAARSAVPRKDAAVARPGRRTVVSEARKSAGRRPKADARAGLWRRVMFVTAALLLLLQAGFLLFSVFGAMVGG